ncbi:methyltransferase family protein [Chitinophaga vietnamensis]|uniref:methyltransferase family protein n=1 Tax=Chitinophaga vietnamensis TaxID=2593957 RepID=UPI0013760ED7|nr:isoprenylcysteine carboxylmethyltransferase family protein [Chitinophaga vietnamensis]
MSLISYIVYFAWLLSEILLHRLLRGGKSSDKKKQDRGSLALIWIVLIICLNIAVVITQFSSYPIVHDGRTMHYIGLAIIIAGMLFRYAAIASLGRLFTVVVTIREGHTIKKDGLYKLIRHPAYAGSLLSFLGFGLSLNNWIGLLVAFVPVLFSFIYRMNIEEKMLLEQFGEAYSDYMRTTKRVLPWIY